MSGDNEQGHMTPTLLQVLLHQERRYYSHQMASSAISFTESAAVEGEKGWLPSCVVRNKIGDWGLRIMDHYNFPRECVSVALNFIDRMMTSYICSSCQDYQLIAVGCVFLAMKLAGGARVLSVDCMVQHIQGRFSKQEIVNMEYKILSTLQWLVHPPTALDFLYHYWNVLVLQPKRCGTDDCHDILDSATFLVEHSVIDAFFSAQKPSVIAIAALSLTIQVPIPGFIDPPSFQLCVRRLHDLSAQNIAATEQHQRTRSPVSVSSPSSTTHIPPCASEGGLAREQRSRPNTPRAPNDTAYN